MVFVGAGIEQSLPAEERAALAWLRGRAELDARYVQLADLASSRLPRNGVVWWHYSERRELPSDALRPATVTAVRQYLEEGGSILLSLVASLWTVPLGLETRPPDQVGPVPGTDFARWPDNVEDRLLAGFRSYRGHPLLRRFWGGTYTATPHPDRTYAVSRYTGDNWPARGAVIAVQQRYIGIDPGQRTVVEYRPSEDRPGGTVLTVGEALWFADEENRNRRQLELFTQDALAYASGRLPPGPAGASIPSTGATALPVAQTMAAPAPTGGGPGGEAAPPAPTDWSELPGVLSATTYWAPRGSGTLALEPPSTPSVPQPDSAVALEAIVAARSGLALEAPIAPGTDFTLATPRTLVVGDQSGRIDDLWGYPVRLLRDLRFGIRRGGGEVEWVDEVAARGTFVSRPEGSSLRTTLADGTAVAIELSAGRERAALVVLLVVESEEPLELVATWQADHAVFWPREAEHLDDLMLGWDVGAQAVAWRDPTDAFSGYAGFGFAPTAMRVGSDVAALPAPVGPESAEAAAGATRPAAEAPTGRVVTLAVPYPAAGRGLTFVVAGGMQPLARSREQWGGMLADPAAVWAANANAARQLLSGTLDLTTPDPTFDEAFRWAKVGLEAFRVTTPGMGTGLTAGYAASRRAEQDEWAAANDFLRRPGYGWYFGRDAVWTLLAADAYGGTDLASEALRFLARYQDVDGKILHEASPAWALHYDAADATPLYLIGLDHHVRTTGDRELLRALWPSVRRAMEFLDSTDTDGDGFIENTDVGHGWIEGGAFYGAHTTFYLASLWTATLQAVERMATWMNDAEMLASVSPRVAPTRAALEEQFWDPERRFYHYGKRRDGTFMHIRTILPAVPMTFGLLDEARTRPLLDLFAGGEISTDWGSRMAERSNPRYNPRGYHDGSVWPLYTGWTSLAAYRYHRPLAAFGRLNTNLRLYRHGNLGRLPEVLHGDLFESIGVTSHQAWSEAMALLPAVEGMLGLEVDAMRGFMRLHPHLPGAWNRISAGPIRVGPDAFRVDVERDEETTRFRIERVAGAAPIQFELSLPFPRSVLVNLDRDATTGVAIAEGERLVDRPTEKEATVLATLSEPVGVVVFRHSRYPRIVEPMPTMTPGEPSTRLRLVESQYGGSTLTVRLEGLPGRPYQLNLITPFPVREVRGLPRVQVSAPGPGRATLDFVIPGTGDAYQRAELTIELRR